MVGLLIITHDNLGAELATTATAMLGVCPLAMKVLSVTRDCDPDVLVVTAKHLADRLDTGDGVLVLADMYGSTPSNVASHLLGRERIRVVTGVNLPMVVRVMNYSWLGLPELAEKALTGGRQGIVDSAALREE